MQRYRFFIFFMVVSLVLILSGCYGNNPMLMELPPPDLETALAELRAVKAISDSLLVSDLVFTPSGETERLHGATSCGLTRCRTTVSGRQFLLYGLADPGDPGFEGVYYDDDVESVRLERYRGLSMGVFRERSHQLEEYEQRGMPVKIEIDTSIVSYEGWMQYSKFAAEINIITHGLIQVGSNQRVLTGQRYGVGVSIGQVNDTNPVGGNATWRGVMVGGRIGETADFGDPVRGDATLTFDFTNVDVDVAFTNIRSVRDVDVPPTYPNMTWQNLPVRNGRFGGGFDTPTIEGRFYGPNHEEVGGIFQRDRVVGAFGAQR
ncbi:MAG: transferrin-binding protein-like solute binding protein [Nitrospira sp.]|nr:transferrin-binding protein-like solute binding protein [Nitrospira sp.]MCY3955603.1 transferrin-binding protein-like solute binding protein [Nitrospira sp.]